MQPVMAASCEQKKEKNLADAKEKQFGRQDHNRNRAKKQPGSQPESSEFFFENLAEETRETPTIGETGSDWQQENKDQSGRVFELHQ
jgi:hypothetical protein